jgi:hypothetical protein
MGQGRVLAHKPQRSLPMPDKPSRRGNELPRRDAEIISMDLLLIQINTEAVRNIIKSHLVSEYNSILTGDLSDKLSRVIADSISDYFLMISSKEEPVKA